MSYFDELSLIEAKLDGLKVLFDKNGNFAFWVKDNLVLDQDLNKVMYVSSSNLWSWDTRKWIGTIVGNGVFRTNGDVLFTLNPNERLRRTRVIKPGRIPRRPSKWPTFSKLPLPDRKIQRTPKSFFVDYVSRTTDISD